METFPVRKLARWMRAEPSIYFLSALILQSGLWWCGWGVLGGGGDPGYLGSRVEFHPGQVPVITLWSRVLEVNPEWCSCWAKTWRRPTKELYYYGCLIPCSFGLIDLAKQDAKNHKLIVPISLVFCSSLTLIFGDLFFSLPLTMFILKEFSCMTGQYCITHPRWSIDFGSTISTSYIFTHFFLPELSWFFL